MSISPYFQGMLGFNWVDLIIIALLAGAVAEGLRIGVLSQLFAIGGFFAVLLIGGWFFPHVVRFHDLALRTAVNTTLVLLTSAYGAVHCLDIAQRVHWSFRLGRLQKNRNFETAETALGALPGLLAGLVVVWLLGVMIGRMPFVGLSNSVNDARIVQMLTRTLPPVPAVFADFDSHIDPNAQPNIATPPKPEHDFNYNPAAVQSAAARATPSVVRVTSFSCGAIAAGSGFVVAPELVATNAHVIAGAQHPVIKYGGKSYSGVPIYFDANLDLTILSVHGLQAPSLVLAPQNIALNTTVAILGYPGGNYRVASGIVRDTRATAGTSIYDEGSFGRGIYVVQGQVSDGSSGGPIVMQNGRVAGIIFSKSTDVSNEAYALTSVQVGSALQKTKTSYIRVSTGACLAD